MKKTGKSLKKDIILIGALALAGAVFAAVLLITMKGGGKVVVRVDGEIIKEFSLNDEVRYEITGADGGRNILVISDKKAWIEDADCRDGLCVNMGKISRSGQSVVCLPHKVVVEISSDESADQDIDVYVN